MLNGEQIGVIMSPDWLMIVNLSLALGDSKKPWSASLNLITLLDTASNVLPDSGKYWTKRLEFTYWADDGALKLKPSNSWSLDAPVRYASMLY